jgi:hypothetical protein
MKSQIENQLSKIELDVNEKEVKNLTRVLIDLLDYYSTLPERQEKMKMLVKATETSLKLTKSYYS